MLFCVTINNDSIGGTILLVIGLYSVLWGKNKEDVKVENREVGQVKEETRLECIIQHWLIRHNLAMESMSSHEFPFMFLYIIICISCQLLTSLGCLYPMFYSICLDFMFYLVCSLSMLDRIFLDIMFYFAVVLDCFKLICILQSMHMVQLLNWTQCNQLRSSHWSNALKYINMS